MDGKTLRLGVSGYLYRNAVLYYDRQTESFWSQMTGEAVVGPWTGKRLKWLPSEVTTWADWKKKHPETTVLKPPRPIGTYSGVNAAYEHFRRRGKPMFPLGPVTIAPDYDAMDSVTIVVRDGKARCYPHPALPEGTIEDGDLRVTKKGISVTVTDAEGEPVPALSGFWYAWCSFYPDGTVWQPK